MIGIDGAVLAREKPYIVSDRSGYRHITMPKDIKAGTEFHMWRYPNGCVLFVPVKKTKEELNAANQ